MPIFQRISDILTANVNDFVDRFENPESMLRQAVREMEAAIAQTMNAAARSIASERLLAQQVAEHRRRGQTLFERAQAAVARSDDDAARLALADRKRHDDLAAALDDQLSAARAHNAKLRRRLDALRVRLSEARQTMHVYIARNRAAQAQRRFAVEARCIDGSADVFQRFDRLCGRIERTEAESQAYLELADDSLADFGGTDSDIETQLAELKATASPSA